VKEEIGLVNYTKFELKKKGELEQVLQDKDYLFVIACKKCFKEFEIVEEPELADFEQIAAEHGKTIIGSVKVDFLCNNILTPKLLKSILPQEAENVFVISCGLGIQLISELTEKPVYAACDTIAVRGHHGMALTTSRCDACAQCYLNLTGGICPIVDCAKSLINGQCGGSKNGKCEVNKEMDCGWEQIYKRLEKQGRVDELINQFVEIRDYSKVNYKFIDEYVKSVREERLGGYNGGIHPTENKEFSENISLSRFPDPLTVVIPLSQHTGAPADPMVEVGQHVKVGEKVGDAKAYVSSPVHSSVSGTVVAIEPRLHPISGLDVLSIIIQSDGQNTLHESVQPVGDLEVLTPEKIRDIIREKGIVGMGGAGFPTAVKINAQKPIEVVLLNGCECEPILTADHRVMIEYADDVLFGLKALIKASHAERGIIAIEDNKPDAIEIMKSKIQNLENTDVVVVKTKYPQGAEKMLIKSILGKQVPRGGLPLDVGVMVSNISTAKAVSDAIQKGIPLIERVVSVSGERMNKPGNYMVKIGTQVKDIIDYCGGVIGNDVTIKMGGPMMGAVLDNLYVPIIKCSNGIIAVEATEQEETECIKCGRCVDVCPMELHPLYYPKYVKTKNWKGMKEENVMDCIECRCCDYICSSKIEILSAIKIGKKVIKEGK
jgi:electron transport complex protein RnfC